MMCAKPDIRIMFFFFFNDTATTEIYTLSLHDALPIYTCPHFCIEKLRIDLSKQSTDHLPPVDRKSTRLNSSHLVISYAVFCLKKKKKLMHLTAWDIVVLFLRKSILRSRILIRASDLCS